MSKIRAEKAAFALSLALLFLVVFVPAVPAADGSYHEDLSVRLQPDENSFNAVAVLTFEERGRGLPPISLDDKARIASVRIDGEETDFTFRDGLIRLPGDAAREVPTEIRIEYAATFSDAPPRRPIHDEDPSYGVTASITPRGTFLGAGSGWHPAVPSRSGTFRVRVEAPEGVFAVIGGKRVGHRTEDAVTVSRWQTTTPRSRLALAAGQFIVGEAAAGDVPVYTYFTRENAKLQQTYLDRSVEYIRMYEKMLVPYPFGKFAVVENFFPTGYGFPSWTLIGGTVLRLPFITETSLGHEIAHSWWGNGVHVDYESGNWSEGLTTYVAEHLYKERVSEEAARNYRMKILRDNALLAAGGKGYPVTGFRSRQSAVDQAVGYGKVAMIFHMLRSRLGDELFFEGLRRLAETRMGRTTSWRDIRSSFETVSERDLSVFFEQWLNRERGPKLLLEGVERLKKGDEWIVSGAVVQEEPYYELQVPLGVDAGGGKRLSVQPMSGERKDFEIKTESPPTALRLDPDVRLFRELHPEEVPPLVNSIRGSDDLLVVVADSLPAAVRDAARRLVAAFRQDSEAVAESELTAGMIEGRDLLFLGWPERFAPPLPQGIEVGPDAFSYDGTSYDADGDALFAVLEHPRDGTRAAAVYLPLGAEAAARVNRKVPHYGKYSILVFRDGKNAVKETWPRKPGPTLHVFDKE